MFLAASKVAHSVYQLEFWRLFYTWPDLIVVKSLKRASETTSYCREYARNGNKNVIQLLRKTLLYIPIIVKSFRLQK